MMPTCNPYDDQIKYIPLQVYVSNPYDDLKYIPIYLNAMYDIINCFRPRRVTPAMGPHCATQIALAATPRRDAAPATSTSHSQRTLNGAAHICVHGHLRGRAVGGRLPAVGQGNSCNDIINHLCATHVHCMHAADPDYTNIGIFCALTSAGMSAPSGFKGTFLDPMKNSYSRGVGTIPTNCGSGMQNQWGLCYTNCASGYAGVGPVCWSQPPDSSWVDCGMGAAKTSLYCDSAVTNQVIY